MVAASFTQTAILRGKNGRVIHIPMTVSDVTAEFAVLPDGNSFIQIPSDQSYAMVDIIVDTGGTDTNFQDIFANGLQTGLRITNKANLNTSNNRQFQTAPVAFKPGAMLRLKQAAS